MPRVSKLACVLASHAAQRVRGIRSGIVPARALRRSASIGVPWLVRATIVLVTALVGCGGGMPRELSSTGGDSFTLFPEPAHDAAAAECSGPREARFRCLSSQLDTQLRRADASGALTVVSRDRSPLVYLRAEGSETVTSDTPFFIASVSKMFLGLATVVLADRGMLDLDAPIAEYLPELSIERGVGRASSRQLLTHTSGVANVAPCESADSDIEDVVRRVGAEPLWTAPGALYNYSNVGYAFVAAVVERVTSQPFEAVVAERVLVPLGIPDATYDPGRVRVRGHTPPGVPDEILCRAVRPAGGLAMTIGELATWLEAIVATDPPIDRALFEALTERRVSTGIGINPEYGLGVSYVPHDGAAFFAHNGGHSGYSAFVAWEPSLGFGVAALANVPLGAAAAASMRAASTFLDLTTDWSPERRPTHPLDAYVGTYEDALGNLGRVRISLEDGHLALDYPNGPPPLLPPDVRFAFVGDSSRATHIVTAVGVGQRVE